MPETFLTIPEVARLLRIGERTAYTLAREGTLGGSVKVGGQWRVNCTAFDRWVRHGGGSGPTSPKKRRPSSPTRSRR